VTLYVVFDAIEKGEISLIVKFSFSQQPPQSNLKVGLKVGFASSCAI
jgi:D-alanyl-D-alanine carboxypeptidase